MQITRRSEPRHALIHKARTASLIPDVGLVLLDSSLKPLAFDQGAASILNYPNQSGVPEEILRVIRSRKLTDLASIRTTFRRGKSSYLCRAYLMECQNSVWEQPMVALHLEKDSSISDAMYEAAAKYNLTEREQEALRGISMGLTNKELAERMSISPNTVRAFLRLIMVKMGVTTRSGIVAKILQDRDSMEKVVSLPPEKELAV
jgi:DNA-binding CsgD family transcriptional regulator